MAMMGVAASIIGELLTGKGALAQLGLETGLPLFEIDDFILAVIGFNLIAALAPASGKFVLDEEEAEERPAGVLQDPSISILDYKRFFGISGFGFTKENEVRYRCHALHHPCLALPCPVSHSLRLPLQLFVGRVAQLGFAISLIGEALTGKGILAQFDYDTSLPLSETEPLLVFFILFTLFAAVNEGRVRSLLLLWRCFQPTRPRVRLSCDLLAHISLSFTFAGKVRRRRGVNVSVKPFENTRTEKSFDLIRSIPLIYENVYTL
jgi:photosystem II protein